MTWAGDPERLNEGRKELKALLSKGGDGSGEGGPEPALCHTVMSTRCGAACGPKQTASQGRAPPAPSPDFPGPEQRLRLRPLALRPRLTQTSAYQPGPGELRATPTDCRPAPPRELSRGPAHQSYKPRPLPAQRFTELLPRPC